MYFHFAPVQGHTDAPYRHFHAQSYETSMTYYTPFIRVEHGNLRPRDLRDFTSELNSESHLVPQIIFRDEEELQILVKLIKENGAKEIDLNMGCPFPLQTGHGRGAAIIGNKNLAERVAEIIRQNEDIVFSVKMRLGLNDPDEWRKILPELNKVSLSHITVHPRIAKQQYGGELDIARFRQIVEQSRNPVIFNGEIKTPQDIESVIGANGKIAGVMIGRGLLGRPSLIKEFEEGCEWDKVRRIDRMLAFHRMLFDHYSLSLCGDSQIISKIKPFWEYAEEEIGRKAWKAIRKAGNIAKYHSAVALI